MLLNDFTQKSYLNLFKSLYPNIISLSIIKNTSKNNLNYFTFHIIFNILDNKISGDFVTPHIENSEDILSEKISYFIECSYHKFKINKDTKDEKAYLEMCDFQII